MTDNTPINVSCSIESIPLKHYSIEDILYNKVKIDTELQGLCNIAARVLKNRDSHELQEYKGAGHNIKMMMRDYYVSKKIDKNPDCKETTNGNWLHPQVLIDAYSYFVQQNNTFTQKDNRFPGSFTEKEQRWYDFVQDVLQYSLDEYLAIFILIKIASTQGIYDSENLHDKSLADKEVEHAKFACEKILSFAPNKNATTTLIKTLNISQLLERWKRHNYSLENIYEMAMHCKFGLYFKPQIKRRTYYDIKEKIKQFPELENKFLFFISNYPFLLEEKQGWERLATPLEEEILGLCYTGSLRDLYETGKIIYQHEINNTFGFMKSNEQYIAKSYLFPKPDWLLHSPTMAQDYRLDSQQCITKDDLFVFLDQIEQFEKHSDFQKLSFDTEEVKIQKQIAFSYPDEPISPFEGAFPAHANGGHLARDWSSYSLLTIYEVAALSFGVCPFSIKDYLGDNIHCGTLHLSVWNSRITEIIRAVYSGEIRKAKGSVEITTETLIFASDVQRYFNKVTKEPEILANASPAAHVFKKNSSSGKKHSYSIIFENEHGGASYKGLAYLHFLIENKDKPFTHRDLLERVFQKTTPLPTESVKLKKLRAKKDIYSERINKFIEFKKLIENEKDLIKAKPILIAFKEYVLSEYKKEENHNKGMINNDLSQLATGLKPITSFINDHIKRFQKELNSIENKIMEADPQAKPLKNTRRQVTKTIEWCKKYLKLHHLKFYSHLENHLKYDSSKKAYTYHSEPNPILWELR